MPGEFLFTLRAKEARQNRSGLKDAFKVYLSKNRFQSLQFKKVGDPCIIEDREGNQATALPWIDPGSQKDHVVQVSDTFLKLHGFEENEKVFVRKEDKPVEEALSISLMELSEQGESDKWTTLAAHEKEHWKWYLEKRLWKAGYVCVGTVLESLQWKSLKHSFRIVAINSSNKRGSLYQVLDAVKANILAKENPEAGMTIDEEAVAGLRPQIELLNSHLRDYLDVSRKDLKKVQFDPLEGAILLFGPRGTGKTLLLDQITSLNWRQVFHIKNLSFQSVFHDAARAEPSLILIDNFDRLCAKASDAGESGTLDLVSSLQELTDQTQGRRILVVVVTRSYRSLHPDFRDSKRVQLELELPIPDATTRTHILKKLSGTSKNCSNTVLDNIGARTHGYVGEDLYRLHRLARRKERDELSSPTSDSASGILGEQKGQVSEGFSQTIPALKYYESALLEIRPNAMNEVFLDTPKVRWEEIGGQHKVKEALKQAIELPLRRGSSMVRTGVRPRKGFLLYGPPGSSKTLVTAALATESDLNFLAVKGPELLSKYVGDSERSLRQLFRKAGAAAPSIIFFDEIDAIASHREGLGSGESGGVGVGMTMLSTLLNELDGIEKLNRVFVLAATNKPWLVDEALLRPGRLDQLIYMGLPDLEARKDILRIKLAQMDIDSDMQGDEAKEWLARECKGYSCAEIINVCETAGYIKLKEEHDKGGCEMPTSRHHFEDALSQVLRLVTSDSVHEFETWRSQRQG